MNQLHTYTSIASELGKEKRTIQLWYQKHKTETGQELGTKQGENGVRYFSDSDRAILCSYGNSINSKPSSFIESEKVAVVKRVDVLLPDNFNPAAAIAKFDGILGQATDPDQIVLLASAMLNAAETTLDVKVSGQREELRKHEKALETVRAMKQDSETNLKIKALESKLLAYQQNSKTEDLQTLFAQIAALGKPADQASQP